MRRVPAPLLAVTCVMISLACHGQESSGIEIRGIDARPGVLHLVPWRLPQDQMKDEPPVDNARFERILEPVDDRVHRQHQRFRQNPGELLEKLSGPQKDGSSG